MSGISLFGGGPVLTGDAAAAETAAVTPTGKKKKKQKQKRKSVAAAAAAAVSGDGKQPDGAKRKRARAAPPAAAAAAADGDGDGDGAGDRDGDEGGTSKLWAADGELADESELELEESTEDVPRTFEGLGLGKWLSAQCRAVGMPAPTSVQAHCVPKILVGRDCCGYAKTGSGKTAAFALPVLQSLSEDPYGVYCVVLTPSRELAFQIGEQFHVLGKPIRVREAVIVGGMDQIKQAHELARRPHVVIATPGRLADFFENCVTTGFGRVKTVVFDEADRLLGNESFRPNLDTILSYLPKVHQTLLFSATPIDTECAVTKAMREPVFRFTAESRVSTVAELRQNYVLMPSHVRLCYFMSVVWTLPEDQSCIVFVSTCRACEELALTLRELDIPSVALHSNMSQNNRMASLGKFRSGFVKYLVATDVASRGLDIAPVKTVVNFNVPKAVNDYIHRVGRTARAGRGGTAITMVSERDVELLQAVEAKIGIKLEEYAKLPREADVLQSLSKVNVARRAANLQIEETDFDERQQRRRTNKNNGAGPKRNRERNRGGKKTRTPILAGAASK